MTLKAQPDVMIGYISGGKVDAVFEDCMLNLLYHPRVGGRIAAESGPFLVGARNLVAKQFMDSPANWLFQLDADMVFPPEVLDILLESSKPEERIVAGLYFGFQSRVRHVWPQIYREDGDAVTGYTPDEDGFVPSFSTGGGAVLIHRSHLEKLGYPYFIQNENLKDQDQIFFHRLRAAGIPLLIQTKAKFGHNKNIIIGEADFVNPGVDG